MNIENGDIKELSKTNFSSSVSFSPDGSSLIAAYESGEENINFWNYQGENIGEINDTNNLSLASFSRTGKYMIASNSSLVKVFDANGVLLFDIPQENNISFAWHPSKNIIAFSKYTITGRNAEIKLWQLP